MQFARLFRFISALSACLLLSSVEGVARDFVDSAGRHVEVPAQVARVFVAGPPASVLLYTLAPDKLLGWPRAMSAAERAYLAPAYRDLPITGRLAGQGSTANVEAVLKFKPDLILDVGSLEATYASLADRVQMQTGIPYVLLDGSFAKTADTYRKLGDLLGVADRAKTLADYADDTLVALRQKTDVVPPDLRPRIYYGRGPNGLETGLAGSINMEVLEAVGGVNVAAAAGQGGLRTVSLEQVLQWNPDVILALEDGFKTAALGDPAWSGIKAVRDKRIYVAPSRPFGWFDSPPGVNRLIGVRWLSRLLYPSAVPDDLRATTRDFYKLFYQVDLTDAQLDELLRNATATP
ncbi:MAG TPA: iron ABC transporter substrate-binding protein [Alphaproteobacteria bacterium]|jgi:iron complex transport system substrate-binding protein